MHSTTLLYRRFAYYLLQPFETEGEDMNAGTNSPLIICSNQSCEKVGDELKIISIQVHPLSQILILGHNRDYNNRGQKVLFLNYSS